MAVLFAGSSFLVPATGSIALVAALFTLLQKYPLLNSFQKILGLHAAGSLMETNIRPEGQTGFW
jgi:hypothetical protein